MSDLGNLSNCMMDGDPGAAGRARRLRRKAFVGSLVLEGALVSALLLWPLISPAVLPAQVVATPMPPYRAEGPASRAQFRNSRDSSAAFTPILVHPDFGQPPHQTATGMPGDNPPGFGDVALGPGQGPSIPGDNNDGRPIEVPRPGTPQRPVNVSAGVMAALLVDRVEPNYPTLAIAMHLSGTVELEARIGIDGTVQELEVVSGNPILARAAIEAVEQWRYQPTRLSGQPVEVETHVTVVFTIQ
jgi:periplasmic protein TonB